MAKDRKDPGISPRGMVSLGIKITTMLVTRTARPLLKERAMLVRTAKSVGNVGVLDILLKNQQTTMVLHSRQQHLSNPAVLQAELYNRISVYDASSNSQPQLFFDLASVADFSNLHVKMISTTRENNDSVDLGTNRCSCENCSDVALQHDGSSCLFPEGDVQCGYELCCNGPFGEYIDVSSSGGTGISFELCTLCRLDDFDHYSRCAFVGFGFALYDDVVPHQGARSLIKRFDDTSYFKPSGCISNQSCSFLDVRAVKSTCDIILDAGSDATVIPVSMISAGNAAQDQTSYLRDAQGARIETEGVRDVSIVLTTVDVVEITIRDKAHVSSRVDCPLISYGKLLRHGWGIVPEGSKSFLVHASGAKVDISFKHIHWWLQVLSE